MLCTAFSLIMNKHLLSNVSFLNNKGYLKLAYSLHFKKVYFSYSSNFYFYHH